MSLQLRRMAMDDLPAVMAIQSGAFTNPWSLDMVKKELTQDWSTVLLAERPGPAGWEVLGFAVFWLVHDEVHVLNVAVHPEARRQGVGRALMEAAVSHGRRHRCATITLEVRRSNGAAQALYESLGFRRVGLRPAYYGDNQEDAVIMTADLGAPSA